MDEIGRAMNLITLGVYVIGVKTPEKSNLMTAAWLTQVSSDPQTLLVAIGKTHYTADLIGTAGCFTVSILTGQQHKIAKNCGFASGRNADKLAKVQFGYSKSGIPVVDGAAAHLECQVTQWYEVEDHVLFIGKVVDAAVYSASTMTYQYDDFFK